MKYVCNGCGDHCETDSPFKPMGCYYEDSELPKDADTWFEETIEPIKKENNV